MRDYVKCNCSLQELLNQENPISIVDYEKRATENSKVSSVYVVYTLKLKDRTECKRRYSEFESFRKSLIRLYPTLLVPPIPEKHSIVEYAHKQLDDTKLMVDKRMRLLERFLNKLAAHPILKNDHVFHRFIDGSTTWSDVLKSPPLNDLPNDVLMPHSITSSITNSLHFHPSTSIPVPSANATPRLLNPVLQETESRVDDVSHYIASGMERSQRRMMTRLEDLSNDYSELGMAYTTIGQDETSPLSNSIGKLAKINVMSSQQTKELVKSLESDFVEHMQEYGQYMVITQQVLRYRRMKQCQLELIEDTLDQKRLQLKDLMRTQAEVKKLKGDESVETVSSYTETSSHSQRVEQQEEGDLDDDDEDGFSTIARSEVEEMENEQDQYPSSASAPALRSTKSQSRRWSSPRKFLSAMTLTLQGMIDTDPEQTRHNQIQKLNDTIEELKQARISTREELSDMTKEIQEELARLEKQKEIEIKSIFLAFARVHLQYCEQNITSWKELRCEVSTDLEKLK
ncbi:hypothetical protein K501DRAFT_328063 [Backusella circina FSU 941]|nr:hypothetical protein K501DRAFT_328063 [Backusella circina FSU 941]